MSDSVDITKRFEKEFVFINSINKELNKSIDDLNELLRLSYDLRDSLKYTSLYFNRLTVKRAKENASKWKEALSNFKINSVNVDTKMLDENVIFNNVDKK